jgi:CBS domain-containing protein
MIAPKLKSISVAELMTPLTTLSPSDSTSIVVGRMVNSSLYEAFIDEGERTALVTIRDLLNVSNIATTKLSTLMRYIPRLNRFNTVGDAATLMFEYRLRSLPVYTGAKVKGQITSQAIVKKLLESEIGVSASEIMTSNPICLDAQDNVSKAREIMIRRKIDQLPILKGGKLEGIVTSEAIVSTILPPVDRTIKGDWRRGRYEVPVEDFADPDVITNDASDLIQQVFENMNSASANYSVIQNLGEVQGIITYRDFMKLLKTSGANEEIPMLYIIGLPEDPFEAEATREKFHRVAKLLRSGFPEITEARAIIKTGETMSPKKKYRVSIFIQSPYWHYSYHVFARELPDAFDYVEDWAKKIMARYQTRRTRVRSDYGFIPTIERFPTAHERRMPR